MGAREASKQFLERITKKVFRPKPDQPDWLLRLWVSLVSRSPTWSVTKNRTIAAGNFSWIQIFMIFAEWPAISLKHWTSREILMISLWLHTCTWTLVWGICVANKITLLHLNCPFACFNGPKRSKYWKVASKPLAWSIYHTKKSSSWRQRVNYKHSFSCYRVCSVLVRA